MAPSASCVRREGREDCQERETHLEIQRAYEDVAMLRLFVPQ